eukprot:Lithocolla_globosa_v1_NODE_6216_length_1121_cov_10.208255.p3 type:complete len:102 gc:universal NODE_6216_length_1121_cov_10.208255:495-190(-)
MLTPTLFKLCLVGDKWSPLGLGWISILHNFIHYPTGEQVICCITTCKAASTWHPTYPTQPVSTQLLFVKTVLTRWVVMAIWSISVGVLGKVTICQPMSWCG